MIFRHLKMVGFKSFAEAAEIEIESGLTGIVGAKWLWQVEYCRGVALGYG